MDPSVPRASDSFPAAREILERVAPPMADNYFPSGACGGRLGRLVPPSPRADPRIPGQPADWKVEAQLLTLVRGRNNPAGAAASLREGLIETLTVLGSPSPGHMGTSCHQHPAVDLDALAGYGLRIGKVDDQFGYFVGTYQPPDGHVGDVHPV